MRNLTKTDKTDISIESCEKVIPYMGCKGKGEGSIPPDFQKEIL